MARRGTRSGANGESGELIISSTILSDPPLASFWAFVATSAHLARKLMVSPWGLP